MKEPTSFLPRLRCPKCKNENVETLAIATQVYWIYPEWRREGTRILMAARSGQVNWSGGPAYYLMCRRVVCGAITLIPASFQVKLV